MRERRRGREEKEGRRREGEGGESRYGGREVKETREGGGRGGECVLEFKKEREEGSFVLDGREI